LLAAIKFPSNSAALEALDDRMLKDMGISRPEIDYLVRHGAAGIEAVAVSDIPPTTGSEA
jgi:hypothetical protein